MALSFTEDYHFFTIQGEGRDVGQPAIFLRLSGCNLRCQWQAADGSINLCDTPYSSHQPESLLKELSQVLEDIAGYPCRYVVVTGGEPYIQKEMADLVVALKERNYFVCIETNGSRYFPTPADFVSVSPKLSTSCVDKSPDFARHQSRRFRLQALVDLLSHHDYQLKYVVNQESDLLEIASQLEALAGVGLSVPADKVFLMPQAIDRQQLQERSPQVIAWAMAKGYRFCDRLHIRLWGSKRGV